MVVYHNYSNLGPPGFEIAIQVYCVVIVQQLCYGSDSVFDVVLSMLALLLPIYYMYRVNF